METPTSPADDPFVDTPGGHRWTGAAQVDLDFKTAKHADFRGSFRTKESGVRIDVLDVYCKNCRRAFEDVADQVCAAVENNEHLRGGPIGERAKRKHFAPPPGAVIIPGARLDRRGVEFLVGETRTSVARRV